MDREPQTYPSTRCLPLSETRIQFFKRELIRAFERQAVGRKLVGVSTFNTLSSPHADYAKFAIFHVVDRIWFVEGPIQGTEYGYQGIGGSYGLGLAEAETRYIIDTIRSHIPPHHMITYSGDLDSVRLSSAFQTMGRAGFTPTVILTNISDELNLWGDTTLHHAGSLAFTPSPAYRASPIPILYSRLMPEGQTLAIDSHRLATLHVKKPLSSEISDISSEEEIGSILENIPSLTREDLIEKVRIACEEIVFLEVNHHAAGVLLESSRKASDTSSLTNAGS